MDSDDDSNAEPIEEVQFNRNLQGIKNNDPQVTAVKGYRSYTCIQNFTNEQWEEIGRDISNNTHLEYFELSRDALDDDKVSHLFRGLTRSSSMQQLWLQSNGLSAAGVRSMVPFLQHANNLRELEVDHNNIQSEEFNLLCRSLRNSPIEELYCRYCDIGSAEIDIDQFPKYLIDLNLYCNNINAYGCREIAKLLQRGDATLTYLELSNNKIDDEGVAILVAALRSNNTSLKTLGLCGNNGISKEGLITLLKLMNDISSIPATLQSNHTLTEIAVEAWEPVEGYQLAASDYIILDHINTATRINENHSSNPEAAGREKVIQTQLHSVRRAELAEIQGVSHSMYSEINPLHLPEVLSLVGRSHGRRELFVALKSSIAEVISTVNKIQYFKQQLAYHEAKSAEMRALLAAAMELAEQDVTKVESDESLNKKRRRD